MSGHQILITDGRTHGRTDARTGVTLYAPPPFFEWRGHKNQNERRYLGVPDAGVGVDVGDLGVRQHTDVTRQVQVVERFHRHVVLLNQHEELYYQHISLFI